MDNELSHSPKEENAFLIQTSDDEIQKNEKEKQASNQMSAILEDNSSASSKVNLAQEATGANQEALQSQAGQQQEKQAQELSSSTSNGSDDNEQEEEDEEEEEEDTNEDDEFIALCTDASSVLNNDPNRRYYINKLYQPMNGQQEDSAQLVEHDDEYLLYQELRFLESATQELDDERQRVQLTKILEDDDGDDDQLLNDDSQSREDPLDRLHMTTIIETFDSFPTSPMIDCHPHDNEHDPLISGVCNKSNRQDDKPDSTMSASNNNIISSVSSSDNITTSNYNMTISQHNQFVCHHQEHFQTLTQQENIQDTHHLLANASLNHDSHLSSQLDELEQYSNHHQDSTSENNYQHQVSSTFVSNIPSSSVHSFERSCDESQNQLFSYTSDETMNDITNKTNKRNSDDLTNDDETDESKSSSKLTKNRTKKRRPINDDSKNKTSSENEDKISGDSYSNIKASPNSNVTSTKLIDDTNKTNDNQEEHIRSIFSTSRAELYDEDDDLVSQDDSSTAGGRRRPPHMSKYRRRTANARERIRMREINQAFEKLKKVVPIELMQSMSGDESDHMSVSSRRGGNRSSNNSDSVKLTKITTLRLAVSYIAKLSEVLSQHPERGVSESTNESNITASGDRIETDSSKATANNETSPLRDTQKRRRRSRRVFTSGEETKLTSKQLVAEKSVSTNLSPLNNNVVARRIDQKQHQIVLSSGLQNGTSATFNNNPLISQRAQQPQITFTPQCIQQSLNIAPASTNSNQDRAFVTPVAVAILGIPSNNHSNEPQALQLLGIQGSQNIQTSSPYNIITQHPQHVTLTLDDINGLSVLRLANSNNRPSNTQQTFQIQQNVPIVQPRTQLVTTNAPVGGYNYTSYQPVQLSQMQSVNSTNIQSNLRHHPTIQFQNPVAISNNSQMNKSEQSTNIMHQGTPLHNESVMASSLSPTVTKTTTTGITSDNRELGMVQANTSAQNLNHNSNFIQTTQLQFQQSNCAAQILPSNLMTVPSGTQFFHTSSAQTNFSNSPTQTNLIYINPSPGNNVLKRNNLITNQSHARHLIQKQDSITVDTQKDNNIIRDGAKPFEQMKFVSQFQRQGQVVSNNEADISQLVASLATSIQPENSIKELSDPVNEQQKQNQPKRTYRFHNYDGNMITNNLYGNNDKHNQQPQQHQQNASKRGIHQTSDSSVNPTTNGQRSRQNSLSSTCSTTSSSSSSLTSLSTSSPIVTIMLKSPTLDENRSRSSSSTESHKTVVRETEAVCT